MEAAARGCGGHASKYVEEELSWDLMRRVVDSSARKEDWLRAGGGQQWGAGTTQNLKDRPEQNHRFERAMGRREPEATGTL